MHILFAEDDVSIDDVGIVLNVKLESRGCCKGLGPNLTELEQRTRNAVLVETKMETVF